MRTLLLSVLVLGTGLVLAETEFTKSSDGLVKEWAQAGTPERRQSAKTQTYAALKRQVRAQNPEDIGAVVRLFGAMYAWDYDPLNDALALFRKRLAEPEFRRIFEDELSRLPEAQRDSLSQGLENLKNRPECAYKGKTYVCTEPK